MNKIWLVVGALVLSGCSSRSDSDTEMGSSSSAQSQSKANAYAKQVTANLDTTTLEQFEAQMPSGMQPSTELSGSNRKFTYTFDDGSKIIATFRPAGAEGSGQGLVLYMVDIT